MNPAGLRLNYCLLFSAGVSLRAMILSVVFSFGLILPVVAGSAPDWLAQVAAKPASFDYGKADAVVLLDRVTHEVDGSGEISSQTRRVIRVLNKGGRKAAHASIRYNSNTARVRYVKAWHIRPSGKVEVFGRKDILDEARFSNALELYGEERQMLISAFDEVDEGSVFAYECVVERKDIFNSETWGYGDEYPVELSSVSVVLPKGWTAEARTFNHEPIKPTTAGSALTWGMQQLSAIEDEPLAPALQSYRPWIAIKYTPPASMAARYPDFSSWRKSSEYLMPHYDRATQADVSIKAKSDALVAGASTRWERIRLLCEYAQKVNYILIEMNTGSGGGMFPRPASKVLRCNYGDCKDKSALLRALLNAQAIESFPLLVCAGNSDSVVPDWPSPSQFNHCVLAIRVDDSVDMPSVIVHPKYGRLMIFDPTNSYVAPGWLAEEDSGGHALLLAGSDGGMIAMPDLLPAQNRTEHNLVAQIDADGFLKGRLETRLHGQAAAQNRAAFRSITLTDYKKWVDRVLVKSIPACRTLSLDPRDGFGKADFAQTVELESPTYGKPMRDTLFIFKPFFLAQATIPVFNKNKRTAPIVIPAATFVEKALIELPAGYGVAELPEAAELKSPFGHYEARVVLADSGHLQTERIFTLSAVTIAAADYESARAFFEKIFKSDQSPVLLRRVVDK